MVGTDYPYEPKEGVCKYDQNKLVGAVLGSYNITAGDEHEMAAVVAKVGPVALSY